MWSETLENEKIKMTMNPEFFNKSTWVQSETLLMFVFRWTCTSSFTYTDSDVGGTFDLGALLRGEGGGGKPLCRPPRAAERERHDIANTD